MAWSSKLPAAIDGLVAAFGAWPGLSGVTVLDGPSTSQKTLQEVLTVGWTGQDGETDADATLAREGLGGDPDRETFSIRCAAAVLRGTDDLSGARRRAYELLSEAGAAIAADRRLGGTVLSAMVGSHSLSQDLGQQGAQAVVTFTVDCDSYTGR